MGDVFAGLPRGRAQLDRLCARGGTDAVRRAFCGTTEPSVKSLADLQGVLGLAFTSSTTGRRNNGKNGNPAFALTGHSSSLVARDTSAINPRAIVFTPPANGPRGGAAADFVALGFARGEQLVEIAARDPVAGALRFFLVVFEQACSSKPGGCAVGELLTPAVEKSWTATTIYEDTDLVNTVVDCTHCHRPDGPSAGKILRFQELQNPWTHFFRDASDGGRALLADFHAAHGTTEDYGPIPAAQIDASEPELLEDLVRGAGFGAQPNEFVSRTIENELRGSGQSTTWNGLYGQFFQGTVIAPPYPEVKVTDPARLQTMTAAYRDFLAGKRTAASLPDLRDVFPAAETWRMGLAPKPGANGKQILTSMCAGCHNPRLDPTVSRARFDVTKLDTMSRAEKDLAIARLKLADEDVRKMPPVRFRSLGPAEVKLAIDELSK